MDKDLNRIFNQYGKITSAVVMRDLQGKSKCFGFVNFENPDDGAEAVEVLNEQKFDDEECLVGFARPYWYKRVLIEMNGKRVISKPLYVALAQWKGDRRAWLQDLPPGVRPAGPPLPNFFVSIHGGQCRTGAGGMPMQQNQLMPLKHEPVLPRGRYHDLPRGLPDAAHAGDSMHQQYDIAAMPILDATTPPRIPVQTTARFLPQANPET
ncbi:hypothetical protein Nepgr_018148 [Nepenthes gracilis]|uniref:RRM domain-containing protein n=1 Tax=Nepenthes gracilis TaxID=150966 RepID=A0AAD3STK5_NEPGR|nr:hypothetical protein Nepgr_018148 [Nepenthes gracilis]